MKLLKLAIRNLLRHKRRTLMSTGAIVIGIFYLIVGKAFVDGITEAIVVGAENGMVGHIMVRSAEYPTVGISHPIDELVTLPAEAQAFLAERGQATTGRTLFNVTVATGQDSMRVRAIGFDPETDAQVFERTTWKIMETEGGELMPATAENTPSTAEDGILVGAFLADLLEVQPGDQVVLQTRTHRGALNALDVPVAGLLRAGHTQLDQSLWVPGPLALELTRAPLPSHVFVRLDDRDDAPAVTAELLPLLGDALEARQWVEETEELMMFQRIRHRALEILVGVLMLMSAFAIANTILMAAYERIREIGTLRAMGMSARGVLTLFLIEGGLMGLGAGALGALGGGSLAWYYNVNPYDFGEMAAQQGSSNIPFSTYIYTSFDLVAVLVPVLMALAVAMLASLYPARVASKMVIADAVRSE